eukprot:5944786-Amphidinium_carterae.1
MSNPEVAARYTSHNSGGPLGGPGNIARSLPEAATPYALHKNCPGNTARSNPCGCSDVHIAFGWSWEHNEVESCG